jgi:hypothetical protein
MIQSFLDSTTGVEVTLDAPAGLAVAQRPLRLLGYPRQLCAVSNKPIAVAGDDDVDGFPVDGLTSTADYLFLVMAGDYAYDRGEPKLVGPAGGLSESAIRQRPALRVDSVPGLAASDPAFVHKLRYHAWWRNVNLSGNHYIMMYGFVGGLPIDAAAAPPQGLSDLSGSVRFRDYS